VADITAALRTTVTEATAMEIIIAATGTITAMETITAMGILTTRAAATTTTILPTISSLVAATVQLTSS
jgi:hypothetical protein